MRKGRKELLVVGDRILVRPQEGESTTKVGLVLPAGVKEKEDVQGGTVVAMGPGIGASVGLAAYFVLEAQRPKPYTCPRCGYSTAGLPETKADRTTCPECGESYDPDEVNTPDEPNPDDLI